MAALDALRTYLFRHCLRNDPLDRNFFPSDLVRNAISHKTIQDILSDSGLEDFAIEEMSRVIMAGAWNVFAILCLVMQPKSITRFAEDDGFQRSTIDSRLPFDKNKLESLLQGAAAPDFHRQQCGFCAPYFSGSVFNRVLPAEFILPFIEDDALPSGQGGFGRCFKVKIESSYQKFDAGHVYDQVIRKELKEECQPEDHRRELRNLAILKLINHPNVVRLLGSYTYNHHHNLLFPYATGGTLKQLMAGSRPPEFKTNESFIFALSGLCSGIAAIHEQFANDGTLIRIGCHHDLKPDNILVEKDQFLVADFGLSRFKESTVPSDTMPRTVLKAYTAPECLEIDPSGNPKLPTPIGRASDVWSLGCIMLEALVYAHFGAKEVGHFEDERFQVYGPNIVAHRFHRGNEEEPAVVSYLEQLSRNSKTRSDQALVELIRDILRLKANLRPSASKVERAMQVICIDLVAEEIEKLYLQLWGLLKTVQVYLERHRFTSWVKATTHLYDEAMPFEPSQQLAFHRNIIFILSSLRKDLEIFQDDPEKPRYSVNRQLTDWNDMLWGSLPDSSRQFARHCLETTILSAEIQSELSTLLQDSNDQGLRDLGALAVLKEMNQLVDKRTETRRPDLWITPDEIHDVMKLGDEVIYGNLTESDHRHTSVIVYEVKRYGNHNLDPSVRQILHCRLESVAEILQKAKSLKLCVLHCLGYFHDPDRLSCGLAYQVPETSSRGHSDVITLREVYVQKKTPPVLGKRFALATKLASSVLEFHKADWLQKDLSSFNILFVFSRGTSWRNGVDQPYFVGFANSRPNDPAEFTEFMDSQKSQEKIDFQHPEYVNGRGHVRYQLKYDYYSVGMIMLEIGLWKPLNKIVKAYGSAEKMLEALKAGPLDQLEEKMGSRFTNAVQACLEGGFGDTKEVCMMGYRKRVLDVLRECVV